RGRSFHGDRWWHSSLVCFGTGAPYFYLDGRGSRRAVGVVATSQRTTSQDIVVWSRKSCKWRREWESNPRFSTIPLQTGETARKHSPASRHKPAHFGRGAT